MKNFLRILLISILLQQAANAATCTAITSGNWESASTWSCGIVPTCGDSIIISPGVTITITSVLDYTACGPSVKLTIRGILTFQTGKKLKLPCDSRVYILNGGTLTAGGGGGSSNLIDICNVTVWNTVQGTLNGPDCLPHFPCPLTTLPVELAYFSAEVYSPTSVKLNWKTASETNNNFFTVERSENGSSFKKIATVNGAGNSTSLQSYSYIDDNAGKGKFYYRIKQTDFNGDFSYSKTVSLKLTAKTEFTVYPNPSNAEIFMDINMPFGGMEIQVNVYDCLGKIFFTKTIFADSDVSALSITEATKPMPPGVYFITAMSSTEMFKEKLVVK